MALFRTRYLLMLLLAAFVNADRFVASADDSVLIKALRELSNQTQGDTLNLPANASSIRENITDTFSCENRTYGYYADVDNDCQVFHVCLPSQTPSGRNVTYRWSFICPNETVFNQEVLTCTRPADSIDCEESPLFYHLNMEIGKVSNKTEEVRDKKDKRKTQRRKQEKIKQNIVMENVVTDIVHDELREKLQSVEFGAKSGEDSPMLIEAVIESIESESSLSSESSTELEDGLDLELELKKEEEMDRIVMERNVRDGRHLRRGAFRFRGDV